MVDNKNLKFEPERAGKRMQVPIPVTWERELSSKGKSSKVWSDLIMND